MGTNEQNEELFREAIARACEQESKYYEENTKDVKHQFSLRHRIRMWRLKRRFLSKKSKKRKSGILLQKRFRPGRVAVAASLLIAMSMTTFAMEPVREGIYRMIEKCFSDHTDISFEKMESEILDENTEIKKFKPQKLEYVPKGYKLEGEEVDETFFMYSADYVGINKRPLYYIQTGIEHFDFNISSNGKGIEKIEVKDKKGYWVKDVNNWNTLLYVEDGYVYMLSGHENIDCLVKTLEKNL
ncbi:MAG: DUF4367 domain-containing protein [Lachnospiraceae bacterium]|nr:DUF4367 domain-containing protein [Lachnospiraceae bacterium]